MTSSNANPTLAECLARHGNDLAAVRLLAATAVLHAHAWFTTTHGLKTEDFAHVFAFTLDFHAVHAFFILSGMLLTRSLMDRQDVLRFTIARLARYVPGILVAALFAALVVGPLVTAEPASRYLSPALAAFVLKLATLADVDATLPGVFQNNPQSGIMFIPLWTIRYELIFAVALAFAGALGLLRMRALVLAGLLAIVAINVVWFWNGEEHLALGGPHHLVRFGSAFALGVALAVFAEKIPVSTNILIALTLYALPFAFSHLAALWGMVVIAYAILCVGFAGGPLTAALARLGAWSYGFYVWGYLIEQTIVHAAPDLSGTAVFLLALPLALAAGWLSWRYVEQPAIARTDAVAAAIRHLAAKLFDRACRPAKPQYD